MSKQINLGGSVFGRLTAICQAKDTEGGESRWLARCECGKYLLAQTGNLKSGHTKSCGCLKAELATSHKLCNSPEYTAWALMLQRCDNPSNPNFHNYGGRGITACERWRSSFEHFIADMGRRPSSEHSLERNDNEKGYEPGNCRWATRAEQARNKRSNHWIEIDGQRKLVSDWAKERGIHETTICHRIERGMSERDAVMTPPRFVGRRASRWAA